MHSFPIIISPKFLLNNSYKCSPIIQPPFQFVNLKSLGSILFHVHRINRCPYTFRNIEDLKVIHTLVYLAHQILTIKFRE
jgi:hypothetical protein